MKTITKLFTATLLAASFFTAATSNAQTMSTMSTSSTMSYPKFKFGVGVSGGLTNSKSAFSYGLGADLKLQLDLMENVSLTASGGYTRLMEKENGLIASYDFIPAIGGVKVFPGIGRMYLNALLGAGFAIKDGSKTSFIFGGGTGYDFENLEIGLRYEGYQQDASSATYQPVNGQYALRIGYNF